MLKHLSLSVQMMASQQAQARAATVKSAAEMAAARAAEISKQLKGNDPEGAEEKRSPDRYFFSPIHLPLGICCWDVCMDNKCVHVGRYVQTPDIFSCFTFSNFFLEVFLPFYW